jgi:hypothetical protein
MTNKLTLWADHLHYNQVTAYDLCSFKTVVESFVTSDESYTNDTNRNLGFVHYKTLKDIAPFLNNHRLILSVPQKLDSRESYNEGTFYDTLAHALEICKVHPDAYIMTGCLWDEHYLTINNVSVFDKISSYFKVYDVPINRLIYVHSNASIPDYTIDRIPDDAPVPKFIYDSFYIYRFSKLKPEYLPEIGFGDKKKHFIMLNRRPSTHRLAVGSYLWKNYKDKINLSCRLQGNNPYIKEEVSLDIQKSYKDAMHYGNFEVTLDEFNQFIQALPLKIDHQDCTGLPLELQDSVPKELLHESACYIIGETHWNHVNYSSAAEPLRPHNQFNIDDLKPNGGFHTEKSLKSFLWGLPAIWIAPAHTLRYLRTLGFKTFGNMIDESYDDEEDRYTRMNMVLAEIDKVAKITDLNAWYQQGIEIYKHNHNVITQMIQQNNFEVIGNYCDSIAQKEGRL